MTFERTRDFALIRSVLTHPALWPHIGDDSAPAVEDWQPNEDERIRWVLARDADELLGVFLFLPQNAVCYEVHVSMLPSAWGARALAAARGVMPWFFAHTGCRKIVAQIPATNRLAIRMARRAGFEQYGINEKSFMKNGILQDQVCLGLSYRSI